MIEKSSYASVAVPAYSIFSAQTNDTVFSLLFLKNEPRKRFICFLDSIALETKLYKYNLQGLLKEIPYDQENFLQRFAWDYCFSVILIQIVEYSKLLPNPFWKNNIIFLISFILQVDDILAGKMLSDLISHLFHWRKTA